MGVGLCWRPVGHSAVEVARKASVKGIPDYWVSLPGTMASCCANLWGGRGDPCQSQTSLFLLFPSFASWALDDLFRPFATLDQCGLFVFFFFLIWTSVHFSLCVKWMIRYLDILPKVLSTWSIFSCCCFSWSPLRGAMVQLAAVLIRLPLDDADSSWTVLRCSVSPSAGTMDSPMQPYAWAEERCWREKGDDGALGCHLVRSLCLLVLFMLHPGSTIFISLIHLSW